MSKQISSLQWEVVFIFTYYLITYLHGDNNYWSTGDFLERLTECLDVNKLEFLVFIFHYQQTIEAAYISKDKCLIFCINIVCTMYQCKK